jgi:hypothetical protein
MKFIASVDENLPYSQENINVGDDISQCDNSMEHGVRIQFNIT